MERLYYNLIIMLFLATQYALIKFRGDPLDSLRLRPDIFELF